MKMLDNLMYQAGGYSVDELANARAMERGQIRQLGRASIISIIASTFNWSIASSLFAAQGTASLIILVFVVVLIPVLTFLLNRTLFYTSDTVRNNDILLPFLKIVLIILVTTLSYQALAQVSGYGKILAFILASFDLYPILLKLVMGKTLAGYREQARMEHEHIRGNLKKQECARMVEQAMGRMNSDSFYSEPSENFFGKLNLEKKNKLALSNNYLESYIENNHLYKFTTFVSGVGLLIFGILNSSLEIVFTSVLLLLITSLIIAYEKILKYRIQRGLFASNSREVRDFINYLNDNADDIDFTDGSGGKKNSLVEISEINNTPEASASWVAGGNHE